jgi:hypothetical protein
MVKDETWPPDLGTVGTVGGGSGSGIPLRLGFYMMIDGRPNSSRPIYFLPKGHVFGEISGSLVLAVRRRLSFRRRRVWGFGASAPWNTFNRPIISNVVFLEIIEYQWIDDD